MKNENSAQFLPTNNRETNNKKKSFVFGERPAFWFGCLLGFSWFNDRE
ncbi:MAG: hypothetical protein WAM95_20205 [Bacillus sp. (in: firmicutes)]